MHVLWKTLRSMIWWKWCVYCSLHKHSWYHLIKILWSLHNGYFHSLQLSSFMGGSLSEIREDGEMSLWKEEYTPASYWGCLPRGFLTWALHRRRTDVSLPCGFLWRAWNSLKAHALTRVRWIEEGKRKEKKKKSKRCIYLLQYFQLSYSTCIKKYHPRFFSYLLQCFQFSAK